MKYGSCEWIKSRAMPIVFAVFEIFIDNLLFKHQYIDQNKERIIIIINIY